MLSALFLAMVLQGPVAAATQQVLPAGTRYDSKIPKLKDVVGHDFGEEITSPEGIKRTCNSQTMPLLVEGGITQF